MRDTSYDTVSGYTSNSTKQQLSGLNDPASQTALQVSEQLQRTKDGVGFLASVVLGAGGIAKTAKIDGNEVEVSQTGGILGGAHKETSKPVNDGFDSHHCPAKDCYKGAPISSANGPAIKMEPADHRETASYGNGSVAKRYRAKQQELLSQGRLQEAVDMDINDIRSKFGDKYDQHILEMQKYIDTLEPKDFIKK
ncbi:TPA: hypothetical protein ACSI5E_001561 [Acinetobacter baumannii]